MKTLLKTSLIIFSAIALASCEKTELIPESSYDGSTGNHKVHQDAVESIGGDLFTDKDKCKKCHTGSGKTMGIDWNAPYMSDNHINSIEELIANFDFAKNVHGNINGKNTSISNEKKQELIIYLNSIALETSK